MQRLFYLLIPFIFVGCAQHQQSNTHRLSTMYDYQITQSGVSISLSTLVEELATVDVVLVGEWHSHSGIHHFQADLLQALSDAQPPIILAMEQFSTDKQSVIDDYLEGSFGELAFIKQGDAWSNYSSDYRPLVEYAKANQIPVIAANAPNDIVRCINREGLDYIAKLPDEKRKYIAQKISLKDTPYKQKFVSTMHHGTKTQINNLFAAQMTRDETMAESIVTILNKYPNHRVMLTAGKFHVEGGLGVGASIYQRAPDLKIVVVNPVSLDKAEGIDKYQLNVLPMPSLYVQGEEYNPNFHFAGKKKDEFKCN